MIHDDPQRGSLRLRHYAIMRAAHIIRLVPAGRDDDIRGCCWLTHVCKPAATLGNGQAARRPAHREWLKVLRIRLLCNKRSGGHNIIAHAE